jgi:hypothetical protein
VPSADSPRGDRDQLARGLARHFGLEPTGDPLPYGDGLVHQTWRLGTTAGPHLVQRLNARVFSDPVAVAENAAVVADAVDAALAAEHDTDARHRLVFRHARGLPWWRDDAGAVWRVMVLIPDARPAASDRLPELRGAARAIGRFPGLVAHGQGPEPRILLPGFHDTATRLAALREVADRDPHHRRAAGAGLLGRLQALSFLAARLPEDLPCRIVHNDAKLDNVLVDAATGRALCLIDLDTAQPGLAAHDFGDLVRSAVSGRPEDEPDLVRVTVDPERFAVLAEGYLEGSATWITPGERATLLDGALAITYEQALRFLADYLAGDVYYAVDDPEHNLRRARAQLALLEDLLVREKELRWLLSTR